MKQTITLVYRGQEVEASLYEGCRLIETVLVEETGAAECAENIVSGFSSAADVTRVISPGGCLKPLMAGCYKITPTALADAVQNRYGLHRYNHLMEICWEAAGRYQAVSYLADAMSVDELSSLNRISSHEKVKKYSRGYALEHRAAMELEGRIENRRPEDSNYIAVHADDFVSIGAYESGRCLDINDGIGSEGPMGFTASGDVPCAQMASYFGSSSLSYREMQELLLKKSGVFQYLGTECPHKLDTLAAENSDADLIVRTMAYQTAKWVGSSAVVLNGKVDGILISGRGVHSEALMRYLLPRIEKIAPVHILKELELSKYLAGKAELISTGMCPVREY